MPAVQLTEGSNHPTGFFTIDSTAGDNELRFDTMVRNINAAFTTFFDNNLTNTRFTLTRAGLERMSGDDFPFSIPGGQVSVLDTSDFSTIIDFLNCAGEKEGVIYLEKIPRYIPTHTPDSRFLNGLFGD